MDLNVCAACGEWSDDFVVAAEEAVLVCAACGQRRPFARLPLFALTGPSGAGKSAVATILAGQLEQCVVLEQDLLWLPDQLDPADEHRQFRRLWLRLVAALHQNGRPVLLCGTVVPGQLEACPERRLVGPIHYLALVCEDAELEARLRARPAWRGWTQEKLAQMLAFNQRVKDNAATTVPPMQLLDTGGCSVQDSAARVRAWVLEQLVASPSGADGGGLPGHTMTKQAGAHGGSGDRYGMDRRRYALRTSIAGRSWRSRSPKSCRATARFKHRRMSRRFLPSAVRRAA